MFVKLSFISWVKNTVRILLISSDKCKLVYVFRCGPSICRTTTSIVDLWITDQDVYLNRVPFESRKPFKSSLAGVYDRRKWISEIVNSTHPGLNKWVVFAPLISSGGHPFQGYTSITCISRALGLGWTCFNVTSQLSKDIHVKTDGKRAICEIPNQLLVFQNLV